MDLIQARGVSCWMVPRSKNIFHRLLGWVRYFSHIKCWILSQLLPPLWVTSWWHTTSYARMPALDTAWMPPLYWASPQWTSQMDRCPLITSRVWPLIYLAVLVPVPALSCIMFMILSPQCRTGARREMPSKLAILSWTSWSPNISNILSLCCSTWRHPCECIPLHWASGLPVAIQCAWNLDPSVHWNSTGESIVGSQCASSGLPVAFQWSSSVFQLLTLDRHWHTTGC